MALDIGISHFDKLFPFGRGNRFLRGAELSASSGAYLNKDKLLAMLSHNVYLTFMAAEIGLDDLVAQFFQVISGHPFPPSAKPSAINGNPFPAPGALGGSCGDE